MFTTVFFVKVLLVCALIAFATFIWEMISGSISYVVSENIKATCFVIGVISLIGIIFTSC